MIMPCKCPHEGQDKLNGKGQRVFTEKGQTKGDKVEYKCTVCGTTKLAKTQ